MARRVLFSERQGYESVADLFQKESMTDGLKHRLWSVVVRYCWASKIYDPYYLELGTPTTLEVTIWDVFFKQPIDELLEGSTVVDKFKQHYFRLPWYKIYDFLEFIAGSSVSLTTENCNSFIKECNEVLSEERSAYRFVDGCIVDQIAPVSIEAIEIATHHPVPGVSHHIKSALALYSKRPAPDYENTIKEAISAVESLAKHITGDKKATLGSALNEIQRNGTITIHPALVNGFKSIYGWTSDDGGIRHGMLEKSNIDSEDARMMLVACSAFINYLTAKADKIPISLHPENLL